MSEIRKLISIVIPMFNEADVIPELAKRLQALFHSHSSYDWEVICVDNGSRDETFRLLCEIRKTDSRFKIVQLSRNFTADGGVAAGLQRANGDCAVLMDADLQDPPEIIGRFITRWQEGVDVVYGIIQGRDGVPMTRRVANRIFYFLINKVSGGMLPENVTAFRLLDRRVYEILNRMPERNRFTRGLCAWAGFRQEGIKFHRAERFAGEPKAVFSEIFSEGLDAFFSFSFVPLRIITVLGLCLSVFCFFFLTFQLVLAFLFSTMLPGYRTLTVLVLMMFGFMLISLGILGEYVARIFDEVKQRPLFIIRDELGFEGGNE
jgi:dolichol-phosphate mannosyltransferase